MSQCSAIKFWNLISLITRKTLYVLKTKHVLTWLAWLDGRLFSAFQDKKQFVHSIFLFFSWKNIFAVFIGIIFSDWKNNSDPEVFVWIHRICRFKDMIITWIMIPDLINFLCFNLSNVVFLLRVFYFVFYQLHFVYKYSSHFLCHWSKIQKLRSLQDIMWFSLLLIFIYSGCNVTAFKAPSRKNRTTCNFPNRSQLCWCTVY